MTLSPMLDRNSIPISGSDVSLRSINRSPNSEGGTRNVNDPNTASNGKTRSRFALIAASLFLISVMFPLGITVGSFALSPYRLVAIACLAPCLFIVVSGRAGRVGTADVLMVLHALFAVLALLVNHGLEHWEFAGMYVVETLGPYFLARCAVRSAADFKSIVLIVMVMIASLLPFTVFEAFTGKHLLRSAFGAPSCGIDQRLGLSRACGPFEHPILYGNFVASCFGIVFYSVGRLGSRAVPSVWAALIFVATFLSLSSGPLSTFAAQAFLIAWDKIMRFPNRWWLLIGLVLAAYVTIDLISNRTPFQVFTTYLSFDAASAYMRVHIYNYGGDEVLRHPLFGIGLHDWVRPEWMGDSVDAFWLLQTMRFGLPSALCLIGALLVLCFAVGRRNLPPEIARFRTGWLIAILGLAVSGITVHYWAGMYCWLMFLLGSSGWMLDWPVGHTVLTSAREGVSTDRNDLPVGPQIVAASTDISKTSPRFCTPKETRWVRQSD